MGDRISISFRNEKEPEGMKESVVLFSHWDGMKFAEAAREFVGRIDRTTQTSPINRGEPQSVMAAFAQEYFGNVQPITGNYYFGFSDGDGDNSDNGHHIIDLTDR